MYKPESIQSQTPVLSPNRIKEAAALLQAGKVVAFPTETVYGLGAIAADGEAVRKIFAAKGRPGDNPLIVHIADKDQVFGLAQSVPPAARILMDRFWPGPLTIVLPVKPGAVNELVTAGQPTVGIRLPDHCIARGLIRAAGRPLAAPSANRSGRPSPTTARHVLDDLDGLIDAVVDGGPCEVGLESTVVEVDGDRVFELRPGGIGIEQIREALAVLPVTVGSAGEASAGTEAPKSPGMKYRHYAPAAEMLVIRGGDARRVLARIQAEISEAGRKGMRTGALVFDEQLPFVEGDVVLSYGPMHDARSAAHKLYRLLRRFDEEGVSFIVAAAPPETGVGLAVMNRLHKASSGRIISV